jgi:hypothetical protein
MHRKKKAGYTNLFFFFIFPTTPLFFPTEHYIKITFHPPYKFLMTEICLTKKVTHVTHSKMPNVWQTISSSSKNRRDKKNVCVGGKCVSNDASLGRSMCSCYHCLGKNTLFLNARHTFFHPSHSRGIYTDNIDVATFCLAVQYFKNMADLGLRLTSK